MSDTAQTTRTPAVWPDGTPKSLGNILTAHGSGQRSVFAEDRSFSPANASGSSASQVATDSREKVEASGRNIGTIAGLSKKSEKAQQDARRYHVTVTQGA